MTRLKTFIQKYVCLNKRITIAGSQLTLPSIMEREDVEYLYIWREYMTHVLQELRLRVPVVMNEITRVEGVPTYEYLFPHRPLL